MKRCLCFLALFCSLVLAGGQAGFAFPSGSEGTVLVKARAVVQIEDDRGGRGGGRRFRFGRGDFDKPRERRSIGAGTFWGGPYWGYGPRWGHACKSCRSSCEDGGDNARCERCRLRCGW